MEFPGLFSFCRQTRHRLSLCHLPILKSAHRSVVAAVVVVSPGFVTAFRATVSTKGAVVTAARLSVIRPGIT